MTKFRASLLGGGVMTLAMLSTGALADGLMTPNSAHSGPYVSLSGGGVFVEDSDFIGPLGTTTFDSDTGYSIDGAVGYRLPTRILGIFQPRVELEVGYLDADIDGSTVAFPSGGETIGDQSAVTLYVNSYSDIRFSDSQRLVPYFGGGIGAAFLDFDARQTLGAASPALFAASDETVLAGHAAIGVSYEMSDRLELFGEGRYFRFSDVDLEFAGPPSIRDDGRIDGYIASAGVRWRF